MRLKKITKNIAGGFLAMTMVVTGMTAPVFADEEVNTFIRENSATKMPQGYISLIDPTNNQIEMMITISGLYAGISGVDIGWVKDDMWRDPRVYTIDANYAQRVFSADGDLSEYHVRFFNDTWKYRFSSEVDLKENPNSSLFYIIRLDNGARMVNEVSYGNCMAEWEDGKGCELDLYRGTTYNNIVYKLVDVVKAFPEGGEDNSEGGETGDEAENRNEKTVEMENSSATTSVNNGGGSEKSSNKIVSEAGTGGESKEEPSEELEEVEESEDDFTEVEEGAGDTTIEVPKLGGPENNCNEINWILIFLGGAGLGAISTWFLINKLGKHLISSKR